MRWLAVSAEIAVSLLAAAILVFGSAHAATTIMTAIVCSPSIGSVITLRQPISDSIVNNANITIAGSVTQSDKVDVFIDTIHRATINPRAEDQTFSTVVSLVQGTHEIKLVSQDMCRVRNGLAVSVVTYQPDAEPSVGSFVVTDTPSSAIPGASLDQAPSGSVNGMNNAPITSQQQYSSLVNGVLDSAQPLNPINVTSAVVALPFVVGAGSFGWIHFRRMGH